MKKKVLLIPLGFQCLYIHEKESSTHTFGLQLLTSGLNLFIFGSMWFGFFVKHGKRMF